MPNMLLFPILQSQEDETKATMRRKAKELQQMRRDAMRGNVRMGGKRKTACVNQFRTFYRKWTLNMNLIRTIVFYMALL